LHSPQISIIHRQIENLTKVRKFLASLERNSGRTSIGYKTSIAYFHNFVSKNYNHNPESILDLITNKEIDVYSLLDDFIGFMQTKNINPSSINQYLAGVRSYLGYYDIDIVPSKFKRRVRMTKVYYEEEKPIDAKDIRQLLLNCHNRKLKAYLLVLASAGLRASEACAIRLSDIDFTTRPTKVHVRKEYTKTRVSREIWISNEATKYLQDWIAFKHGQDFLRAMTDKRGSDTDINGKKKNIGILDTLLFQVQLKNKHVTLKSVYIKILSHFQILLEVSGYGERKEGMARRKITFHSFRRFVKTILSDNVGKEYSEWYLGHAKSGYYVSKPEVRAATYAEKAMKYLTFLDYSTLEATGKNIEAKLYEKDQIILSMKEKYDSDMMLLKEAVKDMQELLKNPAKLIEISRASNSDLVRKNL
jgi:integrase